MMERYDLFTAMITDIYQSVQKIRMNEMKRYGLRTGHVTCLRLLFEAEDGMTMKELSEKGELDKAAISRYMSQMREMGFAEMDKDDSRRYKKKWKLTDKGLEAAEHIDRRIRETVSAVGDVLPEEDRKVLYESLKTIQRNLRLCLKGE